MDRVNTTCSSHLEPRIVPEGYTIIPIGMYSRLEYLGIIDSSSIRNSNVGESNYSKHLIQPWSIWREYKLNPWDADIIKRVLRQKGGSPEDIISNRILDYKKIIHICQEQLRAFKQQGYNID